MPNEIELRECPFCGSPAGAYSRPPVYGGYTFRCNNTDCPIDAETGLFDSEAAAAEAWNKRAPAPAREGEISSAWEALTDDCGPLLDESVFVAIEDHAARHVYIAYSTLETDNFGENEYTEWRETATDHILPTPLAWQPLPEPYQPKVKA